MKPILFNTEMVSAILAGNKTVTRRCSKGVPSDYEFGGWQTNTGNDKSYGVGMFFKGEDRIYVKPKYLIGDILYVRETWFYETHMEDLIPEKPDLKNGRYLNRYIYRASDSSYPVNIGAGGTGWEPSLHMPKEAARLFVRVNDVRVQRLQDATIDDWLKEGIVLPCRHKSEDPCSAYANCQKELSEGSCLTKIKALWNSTVKKQDYDKYSMDANPWVFIYDFEVISKGEAYKEELKCHI